MIKSKLKKLLRKSKCSFKFTIGFGTGNSAVTGKHMLTLNEDNMSSVFERPLFPAACKRLVERRSIILHFKEQLMLSTNRNIELEQKLEQTRSELENIKTSHLLEIITLNESLTTAKLNANELENKLNVTLEKTNNCKTKQAKLNAILKVTNKQF
jgi:hypothetical protein